MTYANNDEPSPQDPKKDQASSRPGSVLWRVGEGLVVTFSATERFIYALYQGDEWVMYLMLNSLVIFGLLLRLLWKFCMDSGRRRRWIVEFLIVATLIAAAYANANNASYAGRWIVFSIHERALNEFIEELKSDTTRLDVDGELVSVSVPSELNGVVREAWASKSQDQSIYVELITGRWLPTSWSGFVYISGKDAARSAGFKNRWYSRRKVAEDWWEVFGKRFHGTPPDYIDIEIDGGNRRFTHVELGRSLIHSWNDRENDESVEFNLFPITFRPIDGGIRSTLKFGGRLPDRLGDATHLISFQIRTGDEPVQSIEFDAPIIADGSAWIGEAINGEGTYEIQISSRGANSIEITLINAPALSLMKKIAYQTEEKITSIRFDTDDGELTLAVPLSVSGPAREYYEWAEAFYELRGLTWPENEDRLSVR